MEATGERYVGRYLIRDQQVSLLKNINKCLRNQFAIKEKMMSGKTSVRRGWNYISLAPVKCSSSTRVCFTFRTCVFTGADAMEEERTLNGAGYEGEERSSSRSQRHTKIKIHVDYHILIFKRLPTRSRRSNRSPSTIETELA